MSDHDRPHHHHDDPESLRLDEDAARKKNWKRWGPYLSERQWGTVREDYSANGECWTYFPHDHARSRTYRWGEDGLLGVTDRECRLSFALALWNGKDPILKERLFGLTGPEGNHGEDVKEEYFYLDATPTSSYLKSLYKYPQEEFPYARLVDENRRRGRGDPELELADTGVFDHDRYFDVFAEYAKAAPDDILIRITIANRGPEAAPLEVLPTLWYRNTWAWGRTGEEGYHKKPVIHGYPPGALTADHVTLGRYLLVAAPHPANKETIFTENESNNARLFGVANRSAFVKDAFHELVVSGRREAVNAELTGTKAAFRYRLAVPPRGEVVLRLRLYAESEAPVDAFGPAFDELLAKRAREADEFHGGRMSHGLSGEERKVVRQARAGLLHSRQFYHYAIDDWVDGDPGHPPPPDGRRHGRNRGWRHLYNRDVISMPDKWEYPWYAAWDLAFHMIAFAVVDPQFAKEQLLLFLREWYMHPNGQIPAYEFAFGDVNPPVHAWAVWRVYKMTGPRGGRDILFLERAFTKLLLNFTWWVNRKDVAGEHIFSGGFLGLDNIGVFDRSQPLPQGLTLEQADGTAWVAFYCSTMLAMAIELARVNRAYEDIASKFFEHFVAIADAMNTLGGTGLWDEADGFYYDQMKVEGRTVPLKTRSMVGVIPLFACEVLEQDVIDALPGFAKRMRWFLENRKDLARNISYCDHVHDGKHHQGEGEHGHGHGHDEHADEHEHVGHRLLAIPSRDRLERVLRRLLDEREFLSPFGLRSLSRAHKDAPFRTTCCPGGELSIQYQPGESETGLFGGNSNWRGPIWFPLNYLLLEALERYDHFFGSSFTTECPTGSGRFMTLGEVAHELGERLVRLFLPDERGRRPANGGDERFARDPHFRELILFHEYFHGDTGRGLGASHQTGWTALVARLMNDLARKRGARSAG